MVSGCFPAGAEVAACCAAADGAFNIIIAENPRTANNTGVMARPSERFMKFLRDANAPFYIARRKFDIPGQFNDMAGRGCDKVSRPAERKKESWRMPGRFRAFAICG